MEITLTICLALVCDSQKSIVAVADRMVSVEFLSLQFEQRTPKVDYIGSRFAVLTAGDALGHTDIIREAAKDINRLSEATVRDVASHLESQFIRVRRDLAEKTVLHRVGLDYSTFLEQQRNLAPELVSALMSEYQGVGLDIELLVTGVDSTGAHLYLVSDPGVTTCFDSIGYAAIGSGLPHAEGFLAEADYAPSIPLNRAVWLTYVAKRRSERAPGVGSNYTDVVVIGAATGAQLLDDRTMNDLNGIYEQYVKGLQEVTEGFGNDVANLSLSFQG